MQAINGQLTQVVRADSTKREVLQQLALEEFDRVVVAIENNISASILTTSVLLGMKIPVIWAKAVDDQHRLILEQLGVHHVIYSEKDMGRRVAHPVRGAALVFIEIAPRLCDRQGPSAVIHTRRSARRHRAAQNARSHDRRLPARPQRLDERGQHNRAPSRRHHPRGRTHTRRGGIRPVPREIDTLARRYPY